MENQTRQVVEALASNLAIEHQAQTQVVDSIFEQQLTLQLRNILQQEIEFVQIINEISQNEYQLLIEKLTRELIQNTFEEERLEE